MKERILFVDNLRALLILIVVLGHSLQYTGCNINENILYNFIQSFQMPLFMFVSGFVSYKDCYSFEWLIRRCKRLLIPYFVGTFIMGLTFREGNIVDYFLFPLKGLWFLWVLAILSILQYLSYIIRKQFNGIGGIIGVVGLFFIVLLLSLELKGTLCFDLIAFHLIFYFTGYLFCRYWLRIKRAQGAVVFIVVFLISVFLSLTFNKTIPSYFPIKNFSIYVRLVGLIVTVSFFLMASVCLDKKMRSLNYIGKNTLGIYVIHRVLFEYRPTVIEIGVIDVDYSIFVFILFLLMTGTSLLLIKLISRNKAMALLLLGK